MGNSNLRKATADQGATGVTGRAVGITGGGALKRSAAPKIPAGAVKSKAEDYEFIEVSILLFNRPACTLLCSC